MTGTQSDSRAYGWVMKKGNGEGRSSYAAHSRRCTMVRPTATLPKCGCRACPCILDEVIEFMSPVGGIDRTALGLARPELSEAVPPFSHRARARLRRAWAASPHRQGWANKEGT